MTLRMRPDGLIEIVPPTAESLESQARTLRALHHVSQQHMSANKRKEKAKKASEKKAGSS